MDIMLLVAVLLLVLFGFVPVLIKAGVDAVNKRSNTHQETRHL